MANYEVVSLRLKRETSEQVSQLAERTGIPKTVLMRQMVEECTKMAHWLAVKTEDENAH